MIKTVSINLGGIVFQIDEDAFEALRTYLDSVTQYYKYQEGRDDIVSDIESRFAEIFSESLAKSGFDVISMGDVNEVIEIMGRPEDFDGEGDRFDGETENTGRPRSGRGKVLYRNKERSVLAGVCSGLSTYWGIKDPLWLRLAFIATALFSAGTIGVVIYIILWIVVPEATTSAQQLEMQGEPVNLSNLEKKIQNEISDAGERLSDFANNEASSGLRSLVNGIGKLFGAVAKLAYVILKYAFIIFVIGMIIVLIGSLIAGLFSFLVALPLSVKFLFTGGAWIFAAVGGILVLIIPLLYLVYLPFRMFGRYRIQNNSLKAGGIGLFIIGVISSFAAATIAVSYFSERDSVASVENIQWPASDTLYVSVNENEDDYEGLDYNIRFTSLFAASKHLEKASDWVELDIVPSTTGNIELEKTLRSRGRTVKKAKANASAITYSSKMEGDHLKLNPFFGFGDNKKWRHQEVKLRLKVPDGLVIVPDHSISSILDDANNTVNASKYTVAGNRWKMHNGRLEPIDSILSIGSDWSKRNMEYINYSDFDRIEIRGDMDVEIVQADNYEVYMIANSEAKREIDIEQDGSSLIITRDGWNWGDVSIGFLGNNTTDPKFYIALPELKSLDVHRQAYVVATGFALDELSLDIGGQSTVMLDGFEIEVLVADIHGQSELEIIGEATKFNLDASGQSNFDGSEFSVNELKIEMSGQSDAEMIVNEIVEGDLYGQSDFEYWGNPEVNVSSYGQSDIDRQH